MNHGLPEPSVQLGHKRTVPTLMLCRNRLSRKKRDLHLLMKPAGKRTYTPTSNTANFSKYGGNFIQNSVGSQQADSDGDEKFESRSLSRGSRLGMESAGLPFHETKGSQ